MIRGERVRGALLHRAAGYDTDEDFFIGSSCKNFCKIRMTSALRKHRQCVIEINTKLMT